MDITTLEIPGLTDELKGYLLSALFMAREAGAIQLGYFRNRHLEMDTKLNDSDVVTIADKESEAAILNYIHAHYPDHGIISEESGADRSDRSWRWVIDPLDGTTSFSAGLPVFCVSIALEHDGETVLGVVYAPYLEECFHAVKGRGSYLNGKRLHCSEKTELSKSVVATGMPYDRTDNPDNNLAEISRVVMHVRGLRRMGSAAIDLSYTAAGFFDAYWELNLNLWDVAAGQLIATEAGVQVGSIRDNRRHSILAANPVLYPRMLALLKPITSTK